MNLGLPGGRLWVRELGWTCTHCYIENGSPTRTCCRAQGTLLNVMWAWMGGELGGEWIHVCGWLTPFAVHLKLSQHLVGYTPIHFFFKENGVERINNNWRLAYFFCTSMSVCFMYIKAFLIRCQNIQACHVLQMKWQLYHSVQFSCFSRVQLCATLWTAAHQAPLSTGFSRQEYWSGLPFPSPTYCFCC